MGRERVSRLCHTHMNWLHVRKQAEQENVEHQEHGRQGDLGQRLEDGARDLAHIAHAFKDYKGPNDANEAGRRGHTDGQDAANKQKNHCGCLHLSTDTKHETRAVSKTKLATWLAL